MTYHITTPVTDQQLDLFKKINKVQDERILRIFQNYNLLSPSLIFDAYKEIYPEIPLTSVRRSINTLTKCGYLVKLKKDTIKGMYGRPEHLWKLVEKAK